jgi:hypothetical protein
LAGEGTVVDEVGGEQLLQRGFVSCTPDIFVEALTDGLVLRFRHRDLSSFPAPLPVVAVVISLSTVLRA